MFVLADQTLEFASDFIDEVDGSLSEIDGAHGLTNLQKRWLTFCILAIAVSNTICWKVFERVSLGTYSHAAISWMFCKSNICWSFLLQASIKVILKKYGITEGMLVLDDTESRRAKQTKRIYHAHKIKDKKSGGYFNGQSLVFLVLVTDLVTIPVGFKFYKPDPALKNWEKENEKLKKQGVPKKERPKKPERDPQYPTKVQIALELLRDFKKLCPQFVVKCVLADALYGSKNFLFEASLIFDSVQVVSQLRKNQNICVNGQKISIEEYFAGVREEKVKVKIRGGKEIIVTMKHQRVIVSAHGKKRLVIALKYEGEKEYRYLVATDLSWLARTVVQAFTFRWLVEVFFQDWKLFEGWDQLAKQPGKEGSERSLILSLLLDHCLLIHPIQLARIENKLPACTVGSLLERVKVDCLFLFMQNLLNSDNPHKTLNYFVQYKDDVFKLASSNKHMSHRSLGTLGPASFLKYYYQNVDQT